MGGYLVWYCPLSSSILEPLLYQRPDRWFELKEIVTSVIYDQSDDALVWVYESKGVYSSQSLYTIINFRGVQPMYIPSVWKINVPPWIQIFLCLLSHNKLMTKDNLLKRGMEKPKECMFCTEDETICHLFFECVVAKMIWHFVLEFCGYSVTSYLELANRWLDCKKYEFPNTISAGALWCIWLTRNDLIFHSQQWVSIKQVLRRILRCMQLWKPMFKQSMEQDVACWCSFLEAQIKTPLAIMPS